MTDMDHTATDETTVPPVAPAPMEDVPEAPEQAPETTVPAEAM